MGEKKYDNGMSPYDIVEMQLKEKGINPIDMPADLREDLSSRFVFPDKQSKEYSIYDCFGDISKDPKPSASIT